MAGKGYGVVAKRIPNEGKRKVYPFGLSQLVQAYLRQYYRRV